MARVLAELSRLTRLTLAAPGTRLGLPAWLTKLGSLRALDVRMECRRVLTMYLECCSLQAAKAERLADRWPISIQSYLCLSGSQRCQ